MFAGVAGILIAPSTNMSILPLIELVIFGYAAAVVGRLRSIPLTFLGAMILGIGNSMVVGYGPPSDVSDIQAALPMVMLFVVLLLIPEVRLTVGRVVRVRAPPRGQRHHQPGGRRSRGRGRRRPLGRPQRQRSPHPGNGR